MTFIASGCCDDYPECYHRVEQEQARPARRKTDTRPALPAAPVSYREVLARGVALVAATERVDEDSVDLLKLASEKLRRDEQNNAECIDILVRAGYAEIPAQVDANLIRRLIGYITPGA